MTLEERVRDVLCEMGYEDAVLFESPCFTRAIVGVSEEGRVAYDFERMVESFMEEAGIERDEAVEFICYNTVRACEYIDDPPIILYRLNIDELE